MMMVSWNRQQVAEWSLTHHGIYTISARAPVYVRAYHEGLIASRRWRWRVAAPARRANTGTRVVLHPILYTVKLYWQNLIDRLGDVYDVMNGLPWLYAVVS